MKQKQQKEFVDIPQDHTKKKDLTSLDFEILAIIYVLEAFKLFIISHKEITIRTDCEAIEKYLENKKERGILSNRWLKFKNAVFNRGTNINWEHIKRKTNFLPDKLSRLFIEQELTEYDCMYKEEDTDMASSSQDGRKFLRIYRTNKFKTNASITEDQQTLLDNI